MKKFIQFLIFVKNINKDYRSPKGLKAISFIDTIKCYEILKKFEKQFK